VSLNDDSTVSRDTATAGRFDHDDLGRILTRQAIARPGQDALRESIEQLAWRLRLPHLQRAAPEVLKNARSQRWDPAKALRTLQEQEAHGRNTSGREIQRTSACFPNQKTFKTWSETARLC